MFMGAEREGEMPLCSQFFSGNWFATNGLHSQNSKGAVTCQKQVTALLLFVGQYPKRCDGLCYLSGFIHHQAVNPSLPLWVLTKAARRYRSGY